MTRPSKKEGPSVLRKGVLLGPPARGSSCDGNTHRSSNSKPSCPRRRFTRRSVPRGDRSVPDEGRALTKGESGCRGVATSVEGTQHHADRKRGLVRFVHVQPHHMLDTLDAILGRPRRTMNHCVSDSSAGQLYHTSTPNSGYGSILLSMGAASNRSLSSSPAEG